MDKKKKEYIDISGMSADDLIFELFMATHEYLEENDPEYIKNREWTTPKNSD